MDMLKKYFATLSLFTLLAIILAAVMIIVGISHQPTEIKSWLLLRLLAAVVCVLALDILFKFVLHLSRGWMWTLEILLLLVVVYLWIISD